MPRYLSPQAGVAGALSNLSVDDEIEQLIATQARYLVITPSS